MPVSTDVNLPKSHKAVWPDRCVACGVERPGGTCRVFTHAIGWWTVAFWSFGERFSVEVPACAGCRRRMRRQWWVRMIVTWGFALAGVWGAMWLLRGYGGPFKKWLAMGLALVGCGPLMVWETFFPPAFDMTAYAETVDYEFGDAGYAGEFAELNGGEVE